MPSKAYIAWVNPRKSPPQLAFLLYLELKQDYMNPFLMPARESFFSSVFHQVDMS